MGAKNINSEWKNGALAFTTTAKNIETLTLIPKKTGCNNADLIRSMWTPSPEIASIFYTDFTPCENTSTTAYPGWTVTQGATAGTIVDQDEVGGVLGLVPAAADDSGVQMQMRHEAFKPATGKDIWFEARVAVTDADQTEIFVGLAQTDLAFIKKTGAATVNSVGFLLKDGDATLFFRATRGTATATSLGVDMVDGTYNRLALYIDSNSHVHAYIDDVDVTNSSKTSWALNEIPHTELAPIMAVRSGEGAANTLYVDYIKCIQLR